MKLLLVPDSSAYSVERGDEVLSVILDGGASKFRKDIIDAAFRVNVAWILDPEGYQYLNAFFRTATARGSLPFEIDLVLDTTEYQECVAHFIPGSFKLTAQKGLSYFVSATLEVEAPVNLTEEADDEEIIDDYEEAHT